MKHLTTTLLSLLLMHCPLAFAENHWSSQAHWDLIQDAFRNERMDCLLKMKEGSEWVDSLPNQTPSKSYMHAMRSSSQTIDEAKNMMANFIQAKYETAADQRASSTQVISATPVDADAELTDDGRLITDLATYLGHCYDRGVALHPVMDSTSPAHADFAIWSITDLEDLFHHGDLPGSIENEQALLSNPDLMKKTVGLMRIINKL